MRPYLRVIITSAVALGLGYLAYQHLTPADFMVQGANHPTLGGAGKPLPGDIVLNDLDGHPHKLNEYRGKLLLVNFWATWCGPCLHEIPELAKLQTQFAARGFQVIGPAVDDPDAVRSMMGALGINYPIMVTKDPEEMIKIMDRLDNPVGGLPFSLLIGTDGVLIKRQVGEFQAGELAQLIQDKLAK